MATIMFVISFIYQNTVRTTSTPNFNEAYALYQKCVAGNYSSRLSLKMGDIEVTEFAYNWSIRSYNKIEDCKWREKVENLLSGKINKPQIEAVMTMSSDDIKAAVVARNYEKFEELYGVAEKTSRKIIDALKGICVAQIAPLGKSREFIRLTLNNCPVAENMYTIDTIRKTVSPFEQKAMDLGGKNAVIHVVSKIMEPKKDDEGAIIRAEALAETWREFVAEGIILNDTKYRVFGHGTNAAKECKLLAVKEEIYDQMREWESKGTDPNWKVTAAKKVAYLTGLHSVYHHKIDIPFQPEDFAIMKTFEKTINVNTTKLFLDGHAEDRDNDDVPVKFTDGLLMMHITPRMKLKMLNRMIERGDDPDEAKRVLNEFCFNTAYATYRANGAALKGLGCKNVDFHSFLYNEGIRKMEDGRNLEDIIFLVDETVIKTSIGEGCAYPSFEAWCDAVRDELAIGTVVHQHRKSKKNVSYQVLQSLCEADDNVVADMANKTVNRINRCHTVEGAAKLLGREWGEIMKFIPELGNEREFKDQIARKMKDDVDDAFSGQLIKDCYYAFVCPDPFAALRGWFGIDKGGCLKAGQIYHYGVKKCKVAMWRSPVMHPNSVRVMQNVDVPEEYRKYIIHDEFCIWLNCEDDTSMAMDMDFDGDHANDTEDQDIVRAAEMTLKKWDRLIVWETPKADKKVIGEEELKEYFTNLTKTNELGLTVFGLNALLNRIITKKDPVTGQKTYSVIPVSKEGVDFKKFAANVLVDASKHGGATIKEPDESAKSVRMVQPWSKQYLDLVRANADQEMLDNLADPSTLKDKFKASTLNKLFAYYANNVRRDAKIDDIPEGKFDFHKIMYDPKEGYRGMNSLIHQGRMAFVEIDGKKMRPDQGLFDSLARRMDADRAQFLADASIKDKESNVFEMKWRANALAELEEYAASRGKTINDVYDVITWYMFSFCDKNYSKMDGSLDFIRNNLWQAYKLIFGAMAVEATEINLNVGEDVCENFVTDID